MYASVLFWEQSVIAMTIFYSYAQLERALCFAFEIDPEQRHRITAKIKALQKQGVVAADRAPGVRSEYTQSDADRWLIGIALLNSSLDPQIVARTIEANWQRAKAATKPATTLEEIVAEARRTPDDDERGVFLFLRLHAVLDTAEPLQEGKPPIVGTEELLTIGYFRPYDVYRRTKKPWENWKLFFGPGFGSSTRAAIPLSLLVHRLDHALSVSRGALA